MGRFKTIIHIDGKSVDDIMRLRCVRSCEKTPVCGIFKFSFYPVLMAHPAPFQSAYTGNVLAEDYEGKWHILTNKEEIKHEGKKGEIWKY